MYVNIEQPQGMVTSCGTATFIRMLSLRHHPRLDIPCGPSKAPSVIEDNTGEGRGHLHISPVASSFRRNSSESKLCL